MRAFRGFGLALRAGFGVCVLALLQSCGSGAVSDPAQVVTSTFSVTPTSATAYPDVVTTFFIAGGSGTYAVISDNQGVVPNLTGAGSAFSIRPSAVSAETKVNLTVKDGTSSVTIPVTVVPVANAVLVAQPTTLAFQGSAAGTCSSGVAADVIVFGGRPPYVASQPGSFSVSPTVITSNPGRFTVTSTGQCAAATAIAVVDSVGATTTVTATNTLSTTPAPTPTTLAVAPTTVTLTSCKDVANVVLVGGSGRYFAATGNSTVYANVNGPNTGYITRQSGTGPPPLTVTVAFSDGITVVPVTVNLTFQAIQPCP